jgi:hydrogenase maturation protease
MEVPQILILGIGNPLLGDDGFGVEVVRRLRNRTDLASVEILDGGAAGVYLLPHLESRTHILVVDAIDFGGSPGRMIVAASRDVPAFLTSKLSEHQVTFHEVLALMELVNIKPKEFLFVGVQPKSSRWGDPFSLEVEASIEPVIEEVTNQVRNWQRPANASYQRSSHTE